MLAFLAALSTHIRSLRGPQPLLCRMTLPRLPASGALAKDDPTLAIAGIAVIAVGDTAVGSAVAGAHVHGLTALGWRAESVLCGG